ncbi:MAG: hypothetical protein KJ846_02225 [Proteobacteria bacterium]|nr:hypothetical protein [Pseudomonadota bacterium]
MKSALKDVFFKAPQVEQICVDEDQAPVTAVKNPLTTPPIPLFNSALIMQARAQIPTMAAVVIPVASANLEVSYPVSTFVALLVCVFVLMIFSFSGCCYQVVRILWYET